MNYVKLNLSFADKMKLLFFDIVSENKLPVKEVIKEVEREKIIVQKSDIPNQTGNPKNINTNTTEDEELVIPFFEINDEDVKSNF